MSAPSARHLAGSPLRTRLAGGRRETRRPRRVMAVTSLPRAGASASGATVAGVADDVIVKAEGGFTTITMNRPERRNALSFELMTELTEAFVAAGESDARGVILAGNGPVFSAGHDFADLGGADEPELRRLLTACTDLITTMQAIPQPVVARVHGLATAAGCQLVATADLAVAADTAGFATPGGKGGWFCHTPLVAVARNVGRKRALELAMTGDTIDAATAADWGLVNLVVPAAELEQATVDLLRRATRGSATSKALGKQAFYAQIDLPQPNAYAYAMDVMARSGASRDAQEGFAAFLEKRPPRFDG
jgi:enoyl-CoA hydratase/carnithine racemase